MYHGCFRRPRCHCVGKILAAHVPPGPLPLTPTRSRALCRAHLPQRHSLPAFFRVEQRHMALYPAKGGETPVRAAVVSQERTATQPGGSRRDMVFNLGTARMK